MIKNKPNLYIIFHPYDDIFSNSTMVFLLERFATERNEVHLYTKLPPEKMGKIENFIKYSQLPQIYPETARSPYIFIKNTILPIIKFWKNILFTKKNKIFIAVDQEGLITMNSLFPLLKKKINYISFEIFSLDEIKDKKEYSLKLKEIKILQKGINSLLIQDKYRNELFFNSNSGCSINRIANMPVAPIKIEHQTKSFIDNYSIKIPAGKKTIIYSGSIYDWSGIKEILYQLKHNWHKDFHLVIHYRFPERESTMLDEITNYQKLGYPITVVIKKFNIQEYHQFLKQFNFGFATYIPFINDHQCDGKNFQTIGYSSGKFNTLMMLGIPTITTNSESFRDLRKEYNYGVIINDFDEIKEALNQLQMKEEEMILETERLYNEVLNPKLYINHYMSCLN